MEIFRSGVEDLSAYGKIPIAFEGHSRLDLAALRQGRFEEIEIPPFRKDYDLLEGPAEWPGRFDTRRWVCLTAKKGHAIVAWNTPGVEMLEDRADLAVLWDLRVAPASRARGVGSALVRAAADWAREQGCRELKVETQDLNVAACRFYAAVRFQLTEIVPDAYPGLDEAMLIWRMPLA